MKLNELSPEQLNNARDRVILELLKLGYSEVQIQNIKKDDDFTNIGDMNVLKDIEECKNEEEYKIVRNDKTKILNLVDSDYLIRPVNIGKNSNQKQVKDVMQSLKAAYNNIGIELD